MKTLLFIFIEKTPFLYATSVRYNAKITFKFKITNTFIF